MLYQPAPLSYKPVENTYKVLTSMPRIIKTIERWKKKGYISEVREPVSRVVSIPTSDLLRAIHLGLNEAKGRYHMDATEIAMGPNEFARLLNRPELREVQLDTYKFPELLLGMRLRIIPWMEGILLLP